MPNYNDFDLDLQKSGINLISVAVPKSYKICRTSYDIGVCFTEHFGCKTVQEDCGRL